MSDLDQRHNQVVLGMIAAPQNGWPSDVALANWQKAGLKVCDFGLKLFTLEQEETWL